MVAPAVPTERATRQEHTVGKRTGTGTGGQAGATGTRDAQARADLAQAEAHDALVGALAKAGAGERVNAPAAWTLAGATTEALVAAKRRGDSYACVEMRRRVQNGANPRKFGDAISNASPAPSAAKVASEPVQASVQASAVPVAPTIGHANGRPYFAKGGAWLREREGTDADAKAELALRAAKHPERTHSGTHSGKQASERKPRFADGISDEQVARLHGAGIRRMSSGSFAIVKPDGMWRTIPHADVRDALANLDASEQGHKREVAKSAKRTVRAASGTDKAAARKAATSAKLIGLDPNAPVTNERRDGAVVKGKRDDSTGNVGAVKAEAREHIGSKGAVNGKAAVSDRKAESVNVAQPIGRTAESVASADDLAAVQRQVKVLSETVNGLTGSIAEILAAVKAGQVAPKSNGRKVKAS